MLNATKEKYLRYASTKETTLSRLKYQEKKAKTFSQRLNKCRKR